MKLTKFNQSLKPEQINEDFSGEGSVEKIAKVIDVALNKPGAEVTIKARKTTYGTIEYNIE